MYEIIEGYDSFTPEVKSQKVIAYLMEELALRKLDPLRIYSMADIHRNETVSLSSVLQALCKMVNDLPK